MMKRSAILFGLLLPLSLLAVAAPACAAQRVPSLSQLMLRSAIIRATAAADFVKLTLPDGSEARLTPTLVIRIRKTIASEGARGAKTRIDWVQTMLVRETPEEVVAQVAPKVPSLGELRLPNQTPIWFNALAAEGPLPLANEKLQGGVLSGMTLGPRIQFLGSDPQKVHDEIAAKGGSSLPVPVPGSPPPEDGTRTIFTPMDEWDADIAQ
jgi:hypothetical protein